jgi:NTE family protein
MASACLPTLFRAIEIENPETGRPDAYWDGGYTGNPALFPLFEAHLPGDILVVNINPLLRDELPTTARAIQNRINEISFNSSLLRELRAIDFVQRLIAEGRVEEGRMKRVLIHMISDDALMAQLSVATKIVPVPAVLHQLFEAGRAGAEAFLDAHLGRVGVESSVDLRAMFD